MRLQFVSVDEGDMFGNGGGQLDRPDILFELEVVVGARLRHDNLISKRRVVSARVAHHEQ